jgi:hypothetical protein
MIELNQETKDQLLDLYRTKRIALEGNILKLIEAGEDEEFKNYLADALEKDNTSRRKRLDITKQVQSQNIDLTTWKKENERIQEELKNSLAETQAAKIEAERATENAENARHIAENDLDMIQRKSQFALMGIIVKVALFVILGVGVLSTIMYITAMYTGRDTQIIGSAWSNLFGILLTNAFSIIGTIMGVKYASEKNNE